MKRLHRRRPNLESLEKRHLLTLIAVDYFQPYWQDQFTVRRDEAEPVELDLSLVGYGGVIVGQGDALEGTVTTVDGDSDTNGAGQKILYKPAAGFTGIDVISLPWQTALADDQAVSDDGTSETTFKIAVNVVEPLLGVADWYQINVNAGATSLDVLANDIRNTRYIGDEPTLALQSVSTEGDGQVTLSDDNTQLVFTPAADFEGVATVTYTSVDQDGYTAEGSVSIRVTDSESDRLWPEQLQQQLIQRAVDAHQYAFGMPESAYYFGGEVFVSVLDVLPPLSTSGSESLNADFSGTNNQLAGVDESDRVKTDGDFLYVLSSPDDHRQWWNIFPPIGFGSFAPPEGDNSTDDDLLTVVDIRQPDMPVVVSRHLFDDHVLSLDLHDDRLSVISQRDGDTVVTALDISDPLAVKTTWTTVVDGSFKQARRVGDSLYVFTEKRGNSLPELESICDASESFCFYETGQQYLDRVSDTLFESVFADQRVYDAEGNEVTDVPTMLVDPLTVGLTKFDSHLNIITFDTLSEIGGAVDWDVTSATEHVLVTPNAIYATKTDYGSSHLFEIDFAAFPEYPTISTEIDRFAIEEDGTVQFAATGAVPGTLQNSFSIDEDGGRLRIATENSWWTTGEDAGTSLYVLEQSDGSLDIVGGVTGLAPGERIYAVRFAGDRAYVVTFRRVDPLFVVDLSDPVDPTVQGQLKVPGYSQYLHIIDDNHIIGVGRDADEETGLFGSLIVSLFDVSDPADPKIQDRYEFEGGRSTFSPFAENDPWELRDHHAISYFPASGILALPVYTADRWLDEAAMFENTSRSAVRTLRIDTESGISVVDNIEFDSRADRTLRIGEHLYSLSATELKVTNLLEPEGVIASLQFEREGQDDFVDVEVGDPVTIDVMKNDGVETEFVEILAVDIVEGDGTVEIVDGNQVRFTPDSLSLAKRRIRYTARDAVGTLINAMATVDPDVNWQNKNDKLDVNQDGVKTARDALNIINMLQQYGAVESDVIENRIGNADAVKFLFDTTGDGWLTARDALLVINSFLEEAKATAALNTVPEAEAIDFIFAKTGNQNDDEEVYDDAAGLF